MKLSIVAGATSQSVNILIQDSSSTTGAGLSGLAFNTASLIAYYTFTGANAGSVAITLATLAAVNSAYSSGGFKEIDATNMKGLYRLDIPNAAITTGKGRVVTLMLSGATNMAPLPLEIELTGWDNQDGVHGGLTAIPNAAAGANTGLPVVGTQVPNATAGASGGLVISGSNAGTTTFGALTVTGATTMTGGLAIAAGATITGSATGAALTLTGGGTSGEGLKILTTSGDGILVTPTAGNAATLTANGTSKHGLVITGGTAGTSDGLKAVAGTGGVDIRGAITGNITGNLSGSVGSLTTNNDKTGYSLTQAFPTNFSSLSIDASGRTDLGKILGTAVSTPATAGVLDVNLIAWRNAQPTPLDSAANVRTAMTLLTGTASAGGATTITLAAAAAVDNLYNDLWVSIDAGTGVGQARVITGYVGSTLVATISPAWTTNPDNTSKYSLIANGRAVLAAVTHTSARIPNVTLADTVTTYTGNTPQTGDNFARLGAPAGASVSADVAAVKALLPSALTGAGNMKSDALALNGDTTSAANIAKTTRAIARGTVGNASTTTSIITSAFAPTGVDADQFKGRIVTFDADTTTTGLRGQATDITASSAAATPVLTVTALTQAPANGDTFSIT